MRKTKPRWSRTKATIESMFAPGLDCQINCTVYTHSGKTPTKMPRHWVVLNGEVIWDFPKDYLGTNPTPGGPTLATPLDPYWKGLGNRSDPGEILRAYLDCPKDELLTRAFGPDRHDLGDILRAADRRLGRTRLFAWALVGLPRFDCPARRVLAARYGDK